MDYKVIKGFQIDFIAMAIEIDKEILDEVDCRLSDYTGYQGDIFIEDLWTSGNRLLLETSSSGEGLDVDSILTKLDEFLVMLIESKNEVLPNNYEPFVGREVRITTNNGSSLVGILRTVPDTMYLFIESEGPVLLNYEEIASVQLYTPTRIGYS